MREHTPAPAQTPVATPAAGQQTPAASTESLPLPAPPPPPAGAVETAPQSAGASVSSAGRPGRPVRVPCSRLRQSLSRAPRRAGGSPRRPADSADAAVAVETRPEPVRRSPHGPPPFLRPEAVLTDRVRRVAALLGLLPHEFLRWQLGELLDTIENPWSGLLKELAEDVPGLFRDMTEAEGRRVQARCAAWIAVRREMERRRGGDAPAAGSAMERRAGE